MKHFLIIFALLTFAAIGIGVLIPPDRLQGIIASLSTDGVASESFDQKTFQARALTAINQKRVLESLPPLQPDPEVQRAITDYCKTQASIKDLNLESLLRHLQESLPNLQSVIANVHWDITRTGLEKSIAALGDGLTREHDSLSTWTFADGFQVGCVAVLSKRLREFDPESASAEGGAFHDVCRRCGNGHLVELEEEKRTVVLKCPACHRAYDVLASDRQGNYRRVTSFLTEVEFDTSGITDSSAQERLRGLWSAVLTRTRYELDDEDKSTIESWKLPAETLSDGRGDCEDTSVLLAAILIQEGFDARVVLGWNAQGGEHAWCVVRLDGKQYLLETTDRRDLNPPLREVTGMALHYHPEQEFDRDQIYFCDGNLRALHDYWTEDIWTGIRYDTRVSP